MKSINGLRNLNLVGLVTGELLVASVADDDRTTLASDDLLVCVEGLGEDVVAGKDHDNGQGLVNECEHTVLKFTGHDSLAVKVGNLLDLEGTLEGSGVLGTTTKKEERLLVLELDAHVLDLLVELKDLLELLRDLAKTLHDGLAAGVLGSTILAERKRKHDHADELRSVCLGGGNTDLGTGVNVDTTVGHHGDGRTDNVDNTNGQGTTLQAVTESHEGVSSLTRLGDEDAGVVTEDRCLSVEEIRGKLDGDGDLSQLLEDTTDSHARVVRGTASDENDSAATADGGDVLLKTTKVDSLVLEVKATTHSVDNRLGLLENLLLHEVVELALHDLLELDLDGLDGANVRSASLLSETVNVELSIVDVSNIVILEVENLLGVLDNGRWVGREEELNGLRLVVVGEESTRLRAVEQALIWGSKEAVARLLEGDVLGGLLGRERTILTELDIDEINLHFLGGADTNDQGRTLAGGDDLVGVVNGLHEKTEGALELLDDGLGQGGEVDAWVLIVDVLGELSDGLGIGLSLELEALALEEHLQLLVVCDDSVVDNGEFPLGVGSADR